MLAWNYVDSVHMHTVMNFNRYTESGFVNNTRGSFDLGNAASLERKWSTARSTVQGTHSHRYMSTHIILTSTTTDLKSLKGAVGRGQ